MPNDFFSNYPDRTGFQFDLPPADRSYMVRGQYGQARENFYGGKYINMTRDGASPSGYQKWTNWMDKFQPDVRFAAVSDKNAHLYAFPEVDSPWLFTTYTYKGTRESDDQTVEPELFHPSSLTVIQPSGKFDLKKIGGTTHSWNETLWNYQNIETGDIFTQEFLEANDWKDNRASASGFSTFTRTSAYKKRFQFKYPGRNKGVRLYRNRVEAESTKGGEHANIPTDTVNMMAPKEYFEPANIYSTQVIPTYIATVGSPIYATIDGIIDYTHGAAWSKGLNYILISRISALTMASASGTRFEQYSASTVGTAIRQPTPTYKGSPGKLRLKIIGTNFSDSEIVHKGCSFFRGSAAGTIGCTLASELGSNEPENVVNPTYCMQDSGYSGTCPHYHAAGAQEIALYEAEAQTPDEFASMWTTIDNYDAAGGGRNLTNSKAIFSGSMTPLGGGSLMWGGMGLGSLYALNNPTTLPRQMGDTDMRWRVEYTYRKIPAMGREIYNDEGRNLLYDDYKQIKRGTGRFSFDTKDTENFGGVDSQFFGDRNLMSSARFNRNVMPCYKPEKCNPAYGIRMIGGLKEGTFSGVGGEEYCRYYTHNCPYSEIPRRAKEYDFNYKLLYDNVLTPFRQGGLEACSSALEEYRIVGDTMTATVSGTSPSGIFAAVAPSGALNCYVKTIPDVPSSNLHVYFYYDRSKWSASGHYDANLFAHIEQYDSGSGAIYMANDGTVNSPSCYPSGVPWLVKLYDDYKSPSEFICQVTNDREFFGGRHPEYKDRSKMGEEVLAVKAEGGGIEDFTRGNKGGEEKHSKSDKGFYMGYWIDKSGEFIDDGRALGNLEQFASGVFPTVPEGPRMSNKPDEYNDATPIYGIVGNSIISPTHSKGATIRSAYIYSSDSRADLALFSNLEDGDTGRSIAPRNPPTGQLPTERSFLRCGSCSWDDVGYDMGGNPNPSGLMDASGYVNITQIVTDWESENFPTCKSCGEELGSGGNWSHFPNVKARGNVTIWGLPGQTINKDGMYWKNPTIVNSSTVRQVVGKLGALNSGGGGYSLGPTNSANSESEYSVFKYADPSGNLLKEGLPEPSGRFEGYSFPGFIPTDEDIADKNETIADTTQIYSRDEGVQSSDMLDRGPDENSSGMTGYSNERLDGGTYSDDVIAPYGTSIPGLDMVTIDQLKNLRNKVEPMYGYYVGKHAHGDYFPSKQQGHKNRYNPSVDRDYHMKPGSLPVQIIAANSLGCDQYQQYWDGGFPPIMIREYVPTGTCWWRINQYIGGISRGGGASDAHFDDSFQEDHGGAWGYTGDKIESNAFFFLHGYLPLDKEVVKAYAIISPATEPSKPPIGVVWSGGKRNRHYHPFMTDHEDIWLHGTFDLTKDSKTKPKWIDGYDSEYADGAGGSEGYHPYTSARSSMFDDIMGTIAHHHDSSFGFNGPTQEWASALEWDGLGQDMVQKYTEDQLWKDFTFQEFSDKIDRDKMKLTFKCGDLDVDGVGYDFTMFSQRLLSLYLNNWVQPITNFQDLSGMNGKMWYQRTGPVVEEKVSDTSWAEGGEVIVQSGDGFKLKTSSTSSTSPSSYSSGGSGNNNGGWATRVLDITDVVKERYDKRIPRAFTTSAGISYDELHNQNRSDRTNPAFFDGDSDPSGAINYRYWNSTHGAWLNDPWHHPKLAADNNLPTLVYGDEYNLSTAASGRISAVSDWYTPPSASGDPENSDYYTYHPKQIITATDTAENSGTPSASGYWYVLKQTSEVPNFQIDLIPLPIENIRRDWRRHPGKWNCANAVCGASECYVGHRNMTVSEFSQYVQGAGKSATAPSITSTICSVCGSDLTTLPATGAIYEGGDGIETVTYEEPFDDDVFIKAISVNPTPSILDDYKHGFDIDVLGDEESRWKTIVSTSWSESGNEWTWTKYDTSGVKVAETGSELPTFFKGYWVNGGDSTSAGAAISGYHFVSPRARYVRYRPKPRRFKRYMVGSSGLPVGSLVSTSGQYEMPSGYEVEDDDWTSATFEMTTASGNFTSPAFTDTVVANTETTFDLAGGPTDTSGYVEWRVWKYFYLSSCAKLEVYGYESKPSYMKVTDSASVFSTPYVIGMDAFAMPDFPSRILSVNAGVYDTVHLPMTESSSRTSSDFYWNTASEVDPNTNLTYFAVTGGRYFFDPAKNEIVLPRYFKNPDGTAGGNIWDLNNDLDPNDFKVMTIPGFVQVEYFTGVGMPINIDVTAVGGGPSYQLEKDSVNFIAGYEPAGTSTPDGIPTSFGQLPSMGQSVKLPTNSNNKYNLNWTVTNNDPLYGDFGMSHIKGNELPAGGWTEEAITNQYFGGTYQTSPSGSYITGMVSGEVTFYGLPQSIISGNFTVYAAAKTKHEYWADGEHIVKWDRTGGLKYTGFSVGVEVGAIASGRQGICFGVPTVVVYLKERDSSIEPNV